MDTEDMNKRIVDLRSDTITQPTPAMRQAMAEAQVGDDVFRDDPTVRELEDATADLLGKEAALFVPSGTMANQLAIRCHTQPGDEILLDANAHVYWYEAGASAALSGAICRVLPGQRGIFSVEDVRAALRPVDVHFPPTRLICAENTHNRGGGAIWPIEQLRQVCQVAQEAGIATHLDGARLWNASIATGIAESEYARDFDSVSVCFSKGLGAPIGSVLAGSQAFVTRARRFRKQFGGGMRQVGIIAAAALYGLKHHRQRLAEDHVNAKQLAIGLSKVPGIRIQCEEVETNMVYFDLETVSASRLAECLHEKNVRVLPVADQRIRAVTSLAVESEDIRYAVEVIGETIATL